MKRNGGHIKITIMLNAMLMRATNTSTSSSSLNFIWFDASKRERQSDAGKRYVIVSKRKYNQHK